MPPEFMVPLPYPLAQGPVGIGISCWPLFDRCTCLLTLLRIGFSSWVEQETIRRAMIHSTRRVCGVSLFRAATHPLIECCRGMALLGLVSPWRDAPCCFCLPGQDGIPIGREVSPLLGLVSPCRDAPCFLAWCPRVGTRLVAFVCRGRTAFLSGERSLHVLAWCPPCWGRALLIKR